MVYVWPIMRVLPHFYIQIKVIRDLVGAIIIVCFLKNRRKLMYYRLREPYCFRGWKLLPYAIRCEFGEKMFEKPYFLIKRHFCFFFAVMVQRILNWKILVRKLIKFFKNCLTIVF